MSHSGHDHKPGVWPAETGKIARHCDGKEPVPFAMNDEDGQDAAAQRLLGRPDGRHQRGKARWEPNRAGGITERGETSKKDEAICCDPIDDGGGHATTQ